MAGGHIKKIVMIALFSALIIVGAFIRIPLPYVPITLQFVFVALSGALLGGKAALCSVLAYISMGLVGLPVFTGGGGISYIFHPTFGYIIGFAIGALVIGFLSNSKRNPTFWWLLIANFIGLIVVYICGVLHFYLIQNFYLLQETSLSYTLIYCFLIFLPTDICFCIIAAITAKKMRPILFKNGWTVTRKTLLMK